MTPLSYLRAAGEALYGARWQTALALDLGVSQRTMQRWAAGSHAIPADVPDRLRALLAARGVRIAQLLKAA